MRFDDLEGGLALRIAREALEAHVGKRARQTFETPARFAEKSGAFVTVNVHPSGELRGCVGFPQPFFPLLKALEKSAEGAAEDPRFPPLRAEELDHVTVEVSLLTLPQLIVTKKPKDLPKYVEIGVDGLSIAQGPYRGLLLPQVAIEQGWHAAEFLSEACMKAGLLADAWFELSTRVYKFQAEIFSEVEPRGPVVRRILGAVHANR